MDFSWEDFSNMFEGSGKTLVALILALDAVRAAIASMGVVKHNGRWGRIVYGTRDKNIVKSTLEDLGFPSEQSKMFIREHRKFSEDLIRERSGVSSSSAPEQLIILLSKYIFRFNGPICYGGSSLSKSEYYIDTMEISHNQEDLIKLAGIMVCLVKSCSVAPICRSLPQVIVTPKGGNPLFAKQVADILDAHLIIAKPQNDKSRIRSVAGPQYDKEQFLINYEGSWSLPESSKNLSCVVMDCNVSGGSQLLDIVKNIRDYHDLAQESIKINKPNDVYILFRADIDGDSVDAVFSQHNCKIHRFFDLNEDAKKSLYQLKAERKSSDNRLPSYYNSDDIAVANTILDDLKQHGLYYYNPEGSISDEEDNDSGTEGVAAIDSGNITF